MSKLKYLFPILVIAIIGLLSAIFIVDEREKVLVMQFGKVVSVKEEPGLG
ncbi:MAG TPA: protease modulator HflC, partial [Roseovarius nubinhibens]|nr:protease modulator HflC [Roseovarius nubinhibens]